MEGKLTPLELIDRLISSQSTLALATSDDGGAPHVAPLFYLAQPDLCLYWLSSASSRHSRNLAKNPAAAVTVYRPTEEWRQICGVQMRGTVHVISERAQRGPILSLYVERFHLGGVLRAAMARSRLYRFQPSWVRYLDNSRRFGYKFECSWPAPGA